MYPNLHYGFVISKYDSRRQRKAVLAMAPRRECRHVVSGILFQVRYFADNRGRMSAWRNKYPRFVMTPKGESILERYRSLRLTVLRLRSFFDLTCDVCFELVNLHDTQTGRHKHITINTASLGKDCLICDVFRKCFEPYLAGETETAGYITLDWRLDLCLTFNLGNQTKTTQWQFLQLYSPGMSTKLFRFSFAANRPGIEATQNYLRFDRDFGTTLLSTSTIANIKVWLQNCDNGHGCMTNKRLNQFSTPFRPTRLIETYPDNNDFVKLDCSTNTDKYAALSYCWGTSVQSTTTKSNISLRQNTIAVSQLPRTLQHAIAITRALGLSRLWVDSVCIVQDDKDDWSKEASKMESVYSEAYVVIAATASADCEEGFLRPRAEPIKVHSTVSSGRSMTVHGRRLQSHTSSSRSFNTKNLPLLRRAWW